MRHITCLLSSLSAWAMAVIYYYIDLKTGVELTALLVASVLTVAVGLYLSCRCNSETETEEI